MHNKLPNEPAGARCKMRKLDAAVSPKTECVSDGTEGLAPQMAIWTEEAPEWAIIDERLEQFPRQPPPPNHDTRGG